MKHVTQLLGIIFSCVLMCPCFASADMTLQKYYGAQCKDYAGIWQGIITDPSDLFSPGGPWPMTVAFYYRNGDIVGNSQGSPVTNTHIWARCKKGLLWNIFWAKHKTDCGAFSQQGLLISKNVMLLTLHYENAMNGANFIAILQRKNVSYANPAPNTAAFLSPQAIQSCH